MTPLFFLPKRQVQAVAITNYSELKTAVQTWLDRQDLSANAGDFIVLAESRLNRILPLRVNWTDAALAGVPGSRALPLPENFVEPVALFLTTFGVRSRLTPLIAGTFEYGTTNGVPSAWCINGSNIDLDVPCDQAHAFAFRYRKSFALSDAAPTNWLLTNHPDVYLFAALVEAAFFIENPDFMTGVHQRLDLAVGELTAKEGRSHKIATLIVDPALLAAKNFNVQTG